MIRSAIVPCAVILTTACFGCAQGPSPVKTFSATCSADGSNFLGHVQFVANGFTPDVYLDPPPSGTGTPIANTTYAQALQNAFLLAPQSFQNTLCGLSTIYVNGPTTCSNLGDCISNSWGYRAWPSQQTYIAISASLWNLSCPGASPGSPYLYHCFETDLLNAVLGWPNPPPPNTPPPPGYSGANPEADNFDVTILAALAHEVGHARWFQVMSPNNSGYVVSNYDPNSFCSSNFFSGSWKSPVQPPPPWRVFLTLKQRNNGFGPPDRHLKPPQIQEIDDPINHGQLTKALINLEKLYQNTQPWASYFGSISPDEDFVETYKFYVLTSAQIISGLNEGPLTSLPITINGALHDIPAAYLATNKPLLYNKTQCIGSVI